MSYKAIRLDPDKFFEEFMNYSDDELSERFGISHHSMMTFLKKNNIELTDEQKKIKHELNLIHKYGSVENFYAERQHLKEEAIHKKYGIINISQLEEQRKLRSDNLKVNRNDPKWIAKSEQSKIERYGDPNFNNREKCKQTMLDRYGVECSFLIPSVKDKAQSKAHTPEAIAKQIKTTIDRHGYIGFQNPETLAKSIKKIRLKETQDKIRTTKLLRYGDPYFNNNEKNKETILEHYGTHDKYVESMTEQYRKTMLLRYGVDNFSKTAEFSKKRKKHYRFNNQSFDSFPELALYIYAIEHDEDIVCEPLRLTYFFDGKEHFYFPDFRYRGNLVEIKGDHFFEHINDKNIRMINPFDRSQDGLYQAKYQCMIDNKVIIMTEKDYKFAVDFFDEHYNLEDFLNENQ